MKPTGDLLQGRLWLWRVTKVTRRISTERLPFKVERLRMLMNDWDPTQPASLWRYLLMFRHVRKSQRLHQAAQIHCMKVLPEGVVAWALWYVAGVPYLLYAHGEEIQMRLTSRKLAWLIPVLYRGATAIIANSYHTKQLLVDIGVRSERIHVIHPRCRCCRFPCRRECGLGYSSTT